ncbi:MAG: zinc-binding dehydrogenase, partial [Acidimicrobiia bacterium]
AEAVLMCTWREVVGAFEDFRLEAGQRVLVVGGGPVGLSFVRFARLLGLAWVGLVDRHAGKREKAIEFGADQVFAPDELPDFTKRNTHSLDAVIDAVGKEEVISSALPLVRMGGSICVYGVIGADSLHIAKSAGPHNFNLLVHQWPTRRHEAAAQGPLTRWIREGSLSASDFVTHEFAIEQISDALAAVQARTAIKCLLHY